MGAEDNRFYREPTVSNEIVEYRKTEAALAALANSYKDVVYDVTTREGMAAAKKGRAEIRSYRVDLEKTRKEVKESALRRCQVIDAEAKRITSALVALEDPIDAQIKKEEQRIEDERNANARAALARVEAEERAKREAEEARLAAERAELDRQRAEIAKAEAARIAAEAEARRKIEDEERAARLRIEEQERQARLAREEEERKARQAREAEDAKLRAERQRLEDERRAAEEAARKEREAIEAKQRAEREAEEAKQKAKRDAEEARQREILRKKNELLDGREMLSAFVARFGHREEFAAIREQIADFLETVAA